VNKCDGQGNPYDYSAMTQIDGYSYRAEKNSEDVITLYLTHAPKVSLKINKHWEDNNNKYNLRPATINFNVLVDGRHSGKTATISKNEDNAMVEGLDKYSNLEGDGVLARYSVYEDGISYYTATVVTNSDYEFTVTNTIDESARTDCALAAVRLLTNETVEEKAIEATITAKDGAPMPNDAEDGVAIRYVSTEGLIDLDDIEFSDEGEYEYEVRLASDSYNIGKEAFTVKLKVKRDIASGTLCVVSVTVIDGDEEVPNGEFDAEISKNESENPNTAATKNTILFVVFGSAIAASSVAYRVIRRR
jgi:hypothetical protein